MGSITVQMTSCLFYLDSAAMLMLNDQQFYLFGQMLTSVTRDLPYSDTFPYGECFCMVLCLFPLTGQASCIAAALGYLTNEGRAIKSDAIAKDFNNLPFVASCDPNLPVLAASDVFQWHGNFNYGDLDKSLSVYFDCIDKAMAADCDQQMLSNLRGCGN